MIAQTPNEEMEAPDLDDDTQIQSAANHKKLSKS